MADLRAKEGPVDDDRDGGDPGAGAEELFGLLRRALSRLASGYTQTTNSSNETDTGGQLRPGMADPAVLVDAVAGALLSRSNEKSDLRAPLSFGTHFDVFAEALRVYAEAMLSGSAMPGAKTALAAAETFSTYLRDIDGQCARWLRRLIRLPGVPLPPPGVAKGGENEWSDAFSPCAEAAFDSAVLRALASADGPVDTITLIVVKPPVGASDTVSKACDRLRLSLFASRSADAVAAVFLGANVDRIADAVAAAQAAGRFAFVWFSAGDLSDIEEIPVLKDFAGNANSWVHIDGDALAAFLGSRRPTESKGISDMRTCCDSVTCAIGQWLQLHNPVAWTFSALPDPRRETLEPGLSFGLWLYMQYRGRDFFIRNPDATVAACVTLASRLRSQASNVEVLRVFPRCEFRFTPRTNASQTATMSSRMINKLNEQIAVDLITALDDNLPLSAVQVPSPDGEGNVVAIALAPLFPRAGESKAPLGISDKALASLVGVLIVETELVEATLNFRVAFAAAIAKHDNVRVVTVPDFVGLGAVQVLPSLFSRVVTAAEQKAQGAQWGRKIRHELDELNRAVVTSLLARDPIFSEGVDNEGAVCVCLGVDSSAVTEAKASEFAQLIAKVADECERGSRIMESLQEVLVLGIKRAEQEIDRETDEFHYQEGVMRSLPLGIGSSWNWMFGDVQKTPTKGRTFSLASEELSSDDHYRKEAEARKQERVKQASSSASRTSIDGEPNAARASLPATPERVSTERSETASSALENATEQSDATTTTVHESSASASEATAQQRAAASASALTVTSAPSQEVHTNDSGKSEHVSETETESEGTEESSHSSDSAESSASSE